VCSPGFAEPCAATGESRGGVSSSAPYQLAGSRRWSVSQRFGV